MDKKEIAQKIQNFLADKGFQFGVYGTCQHRIGIDYACALVKPRYSPVDGAYTIAVDPVSVKGWVCQIPYNYNKWQLTWQKSYSSPEELVAILEEKVLPPVGCWAN